MANQKIFYQYDSIGNLLQSCKGYSGTSFGKQDSSGRNKIRKAVDSGRLCMGMEFRTEPREDDLGLAGEKISDYVERYALMEKACEDGADCLVACRANKVQADVPPIMILAWLAGLAIETESIESFM